MSIRKYSGLIPSLVLSAVVCAIPFTRAARAESVSSVGESAPAAKVNKAAGQTDQQITQNILTELVRDNMGGTYAYKKVKIITVNGQVTLRGKVKNEKL